MRNRRKSNLGNPNAFGRIYLIVRPPSKKTKNSSSFFRSAFYQKKKIKGKSRGIKYEISINEKLEDKSTSSN